MIALGQDDARFPAFASTEHTVRDLSTMNRMLARLRRHVAECAPISQPRHDHIADDVEEHLIVLPRPQSIDAADDLVVVGFFGQARSDVDHSPILSLEADLIGEMSGADGIVAYYNAHVPGDGWGNLVLFTTDAAKERWGRGPLHDHAIGRSPIHYHSIRLHNGELPCGLPGDAVISLTSTKYLDYSMVPAWRAVRRLER